MRDFPESSFVPECLSTGSSHRIYDLSQNGLDMMNKDALIDLLTNGVYNVLSIVKGELDEINIGQLKRELGITDVDGLKEDLDITDVVQLEELRRLYAVELDETLEIMHRNQLKKELETMDIDQLKDLLNASLLKIHNPEYFNVFGIDDPRKKVLSSEEKDLYAEGNFPNSVMTTLPHGGYELSKEVKADIKSQIQHLLLLGETPQSNTLERINSNELKDKVDEEYSKFKRRLKNYSDHGTKSLFEHGLIPEKQGIVAEVSRGLSDHARGPDNEVGLVDFYGNLIFAASLKIGRSEAFKEYKIFHALIQEKMDYMLNTEGGVTNFDLHDTGATDMGHVATNDKFNTGGFPGINLGVQGGASCNPEMITYFKERIKLHLNINATVDAPYKGGYITSHYGVDRRKEMKKNGEDERTVNVIQIEVGKYLYMDESTQKVDEDKAELLGIGISRAQADFGRKFGKEYYSAMEEGPEALDVYLNNFEDLPSIENTEQLV